MSGTAMATQTAISGVGRVTGRALHAKSSGFESPRLHLLQDGHEVTHEAFVHAVRAAVVPRVVDAAARERLEGAKLVYGVGKSGVRGTCYFGAWTNGAQHDFLEIAALGEESVVQLAGTTIHELAHALAGFEHGHGREWKKACAVLGLETAQAAGQAYSPEHFAATVWGVIESLPKPSDGTPTFVGRAAAVKPKPCPLGVGTRGGKSRGVGSGSRLRLWVCGCPEGTAGRKVRVASDEWDATCNRCGARYQRQVSAARNTKGRPEGRPRNETGLTRGTA